MQIISSTDAGWAVHANGTPAWHTLETWTPGNALRLSCDAEPEAAFAEASAIAVEFPAFNDGRALSLAVLLRTRYGFDGALWAIGEVHEELAHYMVRCGFTHLSLSGDRSADQVLEMLAPYSDHYQGSIIEPHPPFRRVPRGIAA